MTEEGDDEADELKNTLDRVKLVVQGFEQRLEALQQQLLAKGTRDVRKSAEEAVEQVQRDVVDALKGN